MNKDLKQLPSKKDDYQLICITALENIDVKTNKDTNRQYFRVAYNLEPLNNEGETIKIKVASNLINGENVMDAYLRNQNKIIELFNSDNILGVIEEGTFKGSKYSFYKIKTAFGKKLA